ncbi:protein Allo56 [Cyprinid herpesvirus 1]|uniref:Protein Allo56 n=2 Tax=Cyprinid herpesvirus 1 TaxID=317858 RepID=K7PBX9_9VIRU|nr:protein Allo56 [Cyprinid herpesvirus 1]AFJ20403.1 protein Allo56 [Cyprinid herpesvirus 1]
MASNLRRFFLQTDEFEEPMVPFVVVIEAKELTTQSNRRNLSFANMSTRMRDALYIFTFLCHKFEGKIYTLFNEPFLNQDQGVYLTPHQRALVSTSISFVFLMSRKRLCEAQDPSDLEGLDGASGGGSSGGGPMPFWMRGQDTDDESNGAFSLNTYDGSMSGIGSSSSGSSDEYFLPTQAQKRLTDAVLDLLAVKMGIACFAHINAGDIKPAIRNKIDFFKCTVQGITRTDVKNMGGSFFLMGERFGSTGSGSSKVTLPGLSCSSLDELLDTLDDFLSQKARTEGGKVQIKLNRRTMCDANTALWFKMRQFLAMHVWEAPVFKRYMTETAQRFAMSLGKELPRNTKGRRQDFENMPDIAHMFKRGTLRIMKELSSSNNLKRITVSAPVDVLAFEYGPHELLRGGVLDGALQDVPSIDFNSFEIQTAVKNSYNLDISKVQNDSTVETYASIMTNYAVVDSINRHNASSSHIHNSNSPEYFATLWPHLYFLNTAIQTKVLTMNQGAVNYMRIRNEVPMLDSVWSLGLNKSSAVMNKLFSMYKKLLHKNGGNYGQAMAYDPKDAASFARYRCVDPPVAAYASLVVKLFGSHIYVSRLLQAELMFKLMAAFTAPRWRTARSMLINYTPTAHGKTLCNITLSLLFKNIDGLLLRKTSFTPASLKYEAEQEMGGTGCTIVFDDASVAGVSTKNASDEVSNLSAMLKNVLDSSVAVSNIAGTMQAGGQNGKGGGDYKSKTVTSVHNMQWVWNVNSLSMFSPAVMDRSLVIAQQQQPRELFKVPDNPATVISQPGVHGDRQDEQTVLEARLQPLAELWITRLHVHISLISVFAPHLSAPAPDERSFLYGLLTHHIKNIFHLTTQVSDPDKKETNRHVDKTTDVYALTAHAMGAFHTLDTCVPPFTPVRYPKRGERLSDYLRSMRACANKACTFRTREDTVLDTACAAILYTGPALLDAFSQVIVQSQGMHLSALAAVIRHIKSQKLFQWSVGPEKVNVTVPRSVLTGYYIFDENCNQLYEMKRCMLGWPNKASEHLVENITVHRSESNAIESFTFDFRTSALYSMAAHLYKDEHEAFEQWYDEQASEIERLDDVNSQEVDASSSPYFHIMFAQLRQALGYGIRFHAQERTGEHTFVFQSPCRYWWSRHARVAAKEALRDPMYCKLDKDKGFLLMGSPVFDTPKWHKVAANFPQPYALHTVTREPNVRRTKDHIFVHWKCLAADILPNLDTMGTDPIYEGNYYGVPLTPQNAKTLKELEHGKVKLMTRSTNKFKTQRTATGEITMWEDDKLAILAAFVDPAVQPARVFSESFVTESGYAHYCAPKTFTFTNKEEKYVLALEEDDTVPYKPHVIFQTDPSRQNTATFTKLSENFFELKEGWEYEKMAEVFQTSTGRTDVTAEVIRDWTNIHWPTCIAGPPPSSYPEYCKDMKTAPDLDEEFASDYFPESHPVFVRMRNFYNNSAKSGRWLSGEEVDWNVVHAEVKRHYNHGSVHESTPTSCDGPSPTDRGVFSFVKDLEEEGEDCEEETEEDSTCAAVIGPGIITATNPRRRPITDDDDNDDSNRRTKRAREQETSFADSFLGDL